jgi:Flp pilus assembly protein CpaB
MNTKTLIPLVAGLAIGGFALWMGFNTLKSARGAQQIVAEVQLWSPKSDIPRGTEITEEMVQPMPFPANLVPPGAVQSRKDLLGRVPRLELPAGLPILADLLLPPGTRPGIYVKPGYRAVAVKIDESSGVDYHLEPGCFVDVVGSFSVQRAGRSEMRAQTIVENVEVAAVGPRVSVVDDTGGKGSGRPESRTVRAVTLFVKPNDVPRLLLTEQQGRIKLSMRGRGDETAAQAPRVVSDRELIGEEGDADQAGEKKNGTATLLERLRNWLTPPAPVAASPAPTAARVPAGPRLPATAWAVAIYRGAGRELVHFKSRDSSERVDVDEKDRCDSIFGTGPVRPTSDTAMGAEPQTETHASEDAAATEEPKEPSE